MSIDTSTPPARARIQVDVYRAADGLRWRIKSSARGRRIISESSESYARKADAFRGLLLTTGGEYVCEYRGRDAGGGVLEQGHIERLAVGGVTEHVFVQYISEETR